jgi:hypothetical protein
MKLLLYPLENLELLAPTNIYTREFEERIVIDEGNIARTEAAESKGFDSPDLENLAEIGLSDSQHINAPCL